MATLRLARLSILLFVMLCAAGQLVDGLQISTKPKRQKELHDVGIPCPREVWVTAEAPQPWQHRPLLVHPTYAQTEEIAGQKMLVCKYAGTADRDGANLSIMQPFPKGARHCHDGGPGSAGFVCSVPGDQ